MKSKQKRKGEKEFKKKGKERRRGGRRRGKEGRGRGGEKGGSGSSAVAAVGSSAAVLSVATAGRMCRLWSQVLCSTLSLYYISFTSLFFYFPTTCICWVLYFFLFSFSTYKNTRDQGRKRALLIGRYLENISRYVWLIFSKYRLRTTDTMGYFA